MNNFLKYKYINSGLDSGEIYFLLMFLDINLVCMMPLIFADRFCSLLPFLPRVVLGKIKVRWFHESIYFDKHL